MSKYCKTIENKNNIKYYKLYEPLAIEITNYDMKNQLNKLNRKRKINKLPLYTFKSIPICKFTKDVIMARTLKKGGRDEVYLTEYPDGNITKIIKCSRPDESGIDTEITAYQKISKQPSQYFPKYYGTIDTSVSKCLLIEYLEDSQDLEGFFGNGYNDGTTDVIITQAYNALDELHKFGIIHGDIGNAKNILFEWSDDYPDGRIVLIDFESGIYFDPSNPNQNNLRDVYDDNISLTVILFDILDPKFENDDSYQNFIIERDENANYKIMIPYLENLKNSDNAPYIDKIIARINGHNYLN